MTIVDRNIQKQQPHKNDSCEAVAYLFFWYWVEVDEVIC